jgi:eukaryotic-like serine/threonine-protein kinase
MISCPNCGTSYPPSVRLCPKDGTVLEGHRPTEERFVGAVLHGKYRLDNYLSSGGMGAVFRATHVMLGKPVAVKLIKADLVTSADMVRRFQREARAATSLNHPSIVSVYDLGQTDDGTLYIAMELVDGNSLKDEIRQHGRIDPPRIVYLLRQIASALAVAHKHQIIHRDLKPQNVMLARDNNGHEVAKLLDFGIAKTFDDAQTQLTATGFALGTPQYMSPEQTMGKEVDARSDIYSLGVMMYEMLIGEVPFTDPSTPAILVKHMTEMPAPPSRKRPDIQIPAHLEAVALRCLEKDPAKRYQTADEFSAGLEAGAGMEPTIPMRAAAAPLDAPTVLMTPADADATIPTPAPVAAAPTGPATVPPPSATAPGVPAQPAATAAAPAAAAPVPSAPAAPPPASADSGTRPTVPAAVQPQVREGSRFGLFGTIAAVILVMAALGGALWLFERSRTAPEQITAGAEPLPPETTPATALPEAEPEAAPTAAGDPSAPAGAPETGTPAAAGAAIPAATASGPTIPPAPAAGARPPSASPPPATPAGRPATPPRTDTPQRAATSAAPAGAAAQPAAPEPAPAAMPADPSVFIECRGPGEVCGAVRTAFDQALQRERLAIARSSDRADIVLVATVTLIDERREQQFGQTMAVRTYSIEAMGDAPRLDRVIPMPSPRTFSFDQRFGAERANENARAIANDAVARVRDFVRKQ